MNKFALVKLEIEASKTEIFKLKKSNRCAYDEFLEWASKAGNFEVELDMIDAVLLSIARQEPILPSRFKQLKRDKSDKIPDYEIRTNNLRLYLFQAPDGRVIVLGGPKTPKDQAQDIARMRTIKKAYFEEQAELQKGSSKETTPKKSKKGKRK